MVHRRIRASLPVLAAAVVVAAACSSSGSTGATGATGAGGNRTLRISAIPDQDPSKLVQINSAMAGYLGTALGVKVQYVPVADYAASVSLFKTGDLDVVFFGGLTGVQARLQAPGSVLLAQRDIDDAFRSVFIASTASGLAPVADVGGLSALRGKRFTFGADTSTSGRLMPAYFLDQAGVSPDADFSGPPGYSGSHDKTIDLVASGTYDAGALNQSVWKARNAAGTVDPAKVKEIFVTPPYHDYHWMAGPRTNDRFGAGFTARVSDALLALDHSNPEQAKLLDLYNAQRFIPTSAANYAQIEQIARKLKLLN